METCCGFGYESGRKLYCLPRIFKGRRRRTGRRVKRDALRMQRPYLWTSQFQGVRSLQRKENSSRGRRQRLRVRLRCRAGTQKGPISAAEFGNINPIPFRLIRDRIRFRAPHTRTTTNERWFENRLFVSEADVWFVVRERVC